MWKLNKLTNYAANYVIFIEIIAWNLSIGRIESKIGIQSGTRSPGRVVRDA